MPWIDGDFVMEFSREAKMIKVGTDAYVMGSSAPEPPKQGYHLSPIPKGTLGSLSKIEEELAELKDAIRQGAKIMELCELSDLVGAIEAYLINNHPNMTFDDLKTMAEITKRSFQSGERK
jgi:hypothetical protein